MTGAPERLTNYVSASEPLVGVFSAEVTDRSSFYREPAVVGVTDRRFICHSDANGFVTIPYEHISSIRSRKKEVFGYRLSDYRVLLAGGVLLTGTGFVAGFVLVASALSVMFILLAASGVVGLSYVYQGRAGEITEEISTVVDRDVTPTEGQYSVLAGGGLLTVLGLSGTFVLTPSLLSAVLTLFIVLLTSGGIVLADCGWRHRRDLDGIDIDRTKKTEVRIETTLGETVTVLVGPDVELDQALSRLVYTAGRVHTRSPQTGPSRMD